MARLNLSDKLMKFLLRFVVSFVVAFLVFYLLGKWYFIKHPLFAVPHIAEVVISFVIGTILYFYSPAVALSISKGVENLVFKAVRKVVMDFWRMQAQRIRQAQKKREKENALKKVKKAAEKYRKEGGRPIVLDTSAIIDGRICEVIKAGFLESYVLVPSFVLDELQNIADSDDSLRRQRGRRGLDILNEIKADRKHNFKVLDIKIKDSVDKELVKLAKKCKARLVTVDFNLNKAAQVEGVKVLNINSLANSLKTAILPGETLTVKLIQVGKEKTQGVGYLEDGTMVVVERASRLIGAGPVEVVVKRVIQTAAGKMIFGHLK